MKRQSTLGLVIRGAGEGGGRILTAEEAAALLADHDLEDRERRHDQARNDAEYRARLANERAPEPAEQLDLMPEPPVDPPAEDAA